MRVCVRFSFMGLHRSVGAGSNFCVLAERNRCRSLAWLLVCQSSRVRTACQRCMRPVRGGRREKVSARPEEVVLWRLLQNYLGSAQQDGFGCCFQTFQTKSACVNLTDKMTGRKNNQARVCETDIWLPERERARRQRDKKSKGSSGGPVDGPIFKVLAMQREGRARCRRHRRLIAQRWAHAKSSFANAGRCRPQSRLCSARVNGLVPKNKGQRALWGWPHLFSARIDKRAKVSERPFSSLGEICKLVLANWKGGGF